MPIYEFECKKCGETLKPTKVFSTFAAGSGCAPPSSGFG